MAKNGKIILVITAIVLGYFLVFPSWGTSKQNTLEKAVEVELMNESGFVFDAEGSKPNEGELHYRFASDESIDLIISEAPSSLYFRSLYLQPIDLAKEIKAGIEYVQKMFDPSPVSVQEFVLTRHSEWSDVSFITKYRLSERKITSLSRYLLTKDTSLLMTLKYAENSKKSAVNNARDAFANAKITVYGETKW